VFTGEKNMDYMFKKFMLGFINTLNVVYGFKISTDRILSLFKVCGEYDFFDEGEARNVMQSLMCQGEEELHLFEKAFSEYFGSIKQNTTDFSNCIAENILDGLEKEKQENEERIAKENAEFSSMVHEFEEQDYRLRDNLKKAVDETGVKNNTALYNILIKDGTQIYEICKMKEKLRDKFIQEIEQEMQDVMIYAIEHELGNDVTDAIISSLEMLTLNINKYKKIENEHKEAENLIDKKIIKITSKKHRDFYLEGKNSVQTEHGYLYKDFRQLSDKDLEKIRDYIKRNAIKIRTKISMAIKKKKQKKLNYRETMKEAVKTDMCPMKLVYKSQKNEKTKIICITDISGSCKNATEILLTFIYALQEAFPGGVESYVFVKQLNDATNIFRSYSLKEANERVSVLVERDYSNYHKAFEQFNEKYFERVTKDTILIYLGDARNNKNLSGAEYLQKIRNKIKNGKGKMYWLNPEKVSKWDTGDSIMNVYSLYMDKAVSIENTKSLIDFLNTMF